MDHERLNDLLKYIVGVRARALEQVCGRIDKFVVDDMMRGRNETRAYLRDDNPRLRFVAVYVLKARWGIDEDFVTYCKTAGVYDDHRAIRRMALACIGKWHKQTHNPDVSRWLVEAICDNQGDPGTQASAYKALMKVNGVRFGTFEEFSQFEYPRDADFSLIARYSSEEDS
jgi:hypothetical protein